MLRRSRLLSCARDKASWRDFCWRSWFWHCRVNTVASWLNMLHWIKSWAQDTSISDARLVYVVSFPPSGCEWCYNATCKPLTPDWVQYHSEGTRPLLGVSGRMPRLLRNVRDKSCLDCRSAWWHALRRRYALNRSSDVNQMWNHLYTIHKPQESITVFIVSPFAVLNDSKTKPQTGSMAAELPNVWGQREKNASWFPDTCIDPVLEQWERCRR